MTAEHLTPCWRSLLAFALLTLGSGLYREAAACVCVGDYGGCSSYESYDVIFIGLALHSTRTADNASWLTLFRVEEALKGDLGSSVSVASDAMTSCGTYFPPGASFVVMANTGGSRLVVPSCSGSKLAEYGAMIVAHARAARHGPVTALEGRILFQDNFIGGWVTIHGSDGAVHRLRSEEDAGFFVYDLPAGKYRVSAEAQPGVTYESMEIELAVGQCVDIALKDRANPALQR